MYEYVISNGVGTLLEHGVCERAEMMRITIKVSKGEYGPSATLTHEVRARDSLTQVDGAQSNPETPHF